LPDCSVGSKRNKKKTKKQGKQKGGICFRVVIQREIMDQNETAEEKAIIKDLQKKMYFFLVSSFFFFLFLFCFLFYPRCFRLNGQKEEVMKYLKSLPQSQADKIRWRLVKSLVRKDKTKKKKTKS
jgi:hypothetical protein